MIHCGDLFDVLPTLEAESIDACVTDPPYGIGFMGKEWDTFKPGTGATRKLMHPRERQAAKIVSDNPNIHGRHRSPALSPSQIDYDYSVAGLRGFQDWTQQWAAEVFRVLKPGAYIVVCGAPRSYHRMACGLEDAGFVVRDCFAWLFLSGFPKSLNFGCKCGGNALQYNHEDSDAGHDSMRRVRHGSDDASRLAEACQASDLLTPLQWDSARRGLEEARSQGPGGVDGRERGFVSRKDVGREQPVMERRELHRAGEGLSDDPDAESSSRARERLRAGTHRDRGADTRPTVKGRRGSTPQGPRSSEQLRGESSDLQLASGALDGGALDRRARCSRCGLLTAASGLGTALKPSNEPIVIARKPFKGTVENCFIQHGTAALNIDASRIPSGDDHAEKCASVVGLDSNRNGACYGEWADVREDSYSPLGRWPANTLLECPDVYPEIAPYLYVAKPSREERDMGCHDLPDRRLSVLNTSEIVYPDPVWVNAVLARRLPADTDSSRLKVIGASTTQCSDGSAWSMCWCGSPSTDPYHPVVKSIIETETSSITPTRISNSSRRPHTNGCMAAAFGVMADGGNLAAYAEFQSPWKRHTGTSRKKAGLSTEDVNLAISIASWLISAPEKPGTGRRNGHPTVKPVDLMRWLVRLVTPIDGVVIDPFAGSGTTGMACAYEQRRFIGIEREAEYVAIAERRIRAVAPLFAEEASA